MRITTEGTIACWGSNLHFQSHVGDVGKARPPNGRFVQITVGRDHSCAIDVHSEIVCWGSNAGRVGFNLFYDPQTELSYDGASIGQAVPPSGAFVQVSAGDYHTCGPCESGEVACWGENHRLQSWPFTQVEETNQAVPPAGQFTHISAASDSSCGVQASGPSMQEAMHLVEERAWKQALGAIPIAGLAFTAYFAFEDLSDRDAVYAIGDWFEKYPPYQRLAQSLRFANQFIADRYTELITRLGIHPVVPESLAP